MGAIRCTCTEKFRKSNGQIFGYRLQAADGSVLDIEHDELKKKIKGNRIIVDNLQISIDGKLVDKAPTATNLDDLERFIVEAVNTNKGALPLNKIDKNNISIRVYQEYKSMGGSEDVWVSHSEGYMTVISVSGGKIDSTTYSYTETDGSDIEYEHIKKRTDRCRKTDATKENVVKYGLVWDRSNAFNYSKMPKQQMLQEIVTERRTEKQEKQSVVNNDKRDKFNQLAKVIRETYETREIPNDMLQSYGRGGSEYVAVITGDNRGVIIFPTMEYGQYTLSNNGNDNVGIYDIKKIHNMGEIKDILFMSASKKQNATDVKDSGVRVLGYNNGHEILEGSGGYSGSLTTWNSLDYWKSLDPEEREAEINDPKSPWYHYSGVNNKDDQNPYPDWY